MTRFERIRQRREMHKRIRAVVAERRTAERTAPFTPDDDEEPTAEMRVEAETA
jgi:hypothetical protein